MIVHTAYVLADLVSLAPLSILLSINEFQICGKHTCKKTSSRSGRADNNQFQHSTIVLIASGWNRMTGARVKVNNCLSSIFGFIKIKEADSFHTASSYLFISFLLKFFILAIFPVRSTSEEKKM